MCAMYRIAIQNRTKEEAIKEIMQDGGLMIRKNCWEVKECGREPGGKNSEKLDKLVTAYLFLFE